MNFARTQKYDQKLDLEFSSQEEKMRIGRWRIWIIGELVLLR